MKKKKLLIILPEIYGRNKFIEDEILYYESRGFLVFCPDFYEALGYEEDGAYELFMEKVGLNGSWLRVLIEAVRGKYDKVFLLGYSVGGTLAWRQARGTDGIISIYGSRIRDYLDERPQVPSLLILSRDEKFELEGAHVFDAAHGFMDSHGPNYNSELAKKARFLIDEFLDRR